MDFCKMGPYDFVMGLINNTLNAFLNNNKISILSFGYITNHIQIEH